MVPQSSEVFRAQLRLAFLVSLGLMIVAFGAAEWKGYSGSPAGAGLAGALVHSTAYYHTVFTIWVTTILLTVALCSYVLSSSEELGGYWLGFWTGSYIALLTHLFWTIVVTFRLNFSEIFHSRIGMAKDPDRVVQNPGPDLVFAAWWGLDVVLAWTVRSDSKWLKRERGAVHVVAFVMFFGATAMAAKASTTAHVLGYLMAGVVVGSVALRLFRRRATRHRG